MKAAPEPFEISSLGLRIETQSCYSGRIELQGQLSDEFFLAGERDIICPADSPLLMARISPELSAALGFDGVTIPDTEKPVMVRVTIDHHHSLACNCPCYGECDCTCLCSTNLEDGSLDDFDIDY